MAQISLPVQAGGREVKERRGDKKVFGRSVARV